MTSPFRAGPAVRRLRATAAALALVLPLQACGAWDYMFGSAPDPEDMTEIQMERPVFAPPPQAVAPKWPTPWRRGELRAP